MSDRQIIVDLPVRRYALVADLIHGQQMIVVHGGDIEAAPRWSGFVRWVGGVKPATQRYAKRRVA